MQTSRDRFLIAILCVQAAVNAINGSSALIALLGQAVADGTSLISAAMSAATAAYVAATREQVSSYERTRKNDKPNV